ncbi:DNA primase [Mycobacterium phage PattyP]|uniref:DNA primase n=1 Tax=Mycobacterium phage PattyP TaxID=1327773 RepID=UPI00032B38F4|nr:DNA primase [Mycobacterium phage PattyP]AGK87342.1 DNA primase [Mycobacterium phage PattyP]
MSSHRNFLLEASKQYHQALPGSEGEEYLATRGLTNPAISDAVSKFRLGYVAEPLPGHEMYKGMLAIPYLRWAPDIGWQVVSLRFRRIEAAEGKAKYLTVPGDKPRMFNTIALLQPSQKVALCEGEADTITATAAGIPAVGVPGAQAWKEHFREPFLGYREVLILADGDDAGMQFAETVAGVLPNAKIIPMPDGSDVNSLVLEQGVQALKDKVGI